VANGDWYLCASSLHLYPDAFQEVAADFGVVFDGHASGMAV
jgi:hypothetical protein